MVRTTWDWEAELRGWLEPFLGRLGHMPNRESAVAGGRPDVKIARVVPVRASAGAAPNSEITRRAMAGAGSMKLTGHGASWRKRSMIKG